MSAATNELNNLYCIVDCNKFQSDGETNIIVKQGNLSERFNAFGFETFEVDGHCFESINSSLRIKQTRRNLQLLLQIRLKERGNKNGKQQLMASCSDNRIYLRRN